MRKRLVKKLQKKNDNRYELSDLEELMVLAHLINQHEEGCVFVRDNGHVSQLEIDIAANKRRYQLKEESFKVYYDENQDHKAAEIKELKKELVRLNEILVTKKD